MQVVCEATITIQTASSGSRLVINSSGLKAYNGSGTNTVSINSDGTATFNGTINGGSITSGTTINVTSDCTVGVNLTVGKKLILSTTDFGAGIQWGTATSRPEIFIDPGGGALVIHNPNGGIYANGYRIDTASIATFG